MGFTFYKEEKFKETPGGNFPRDWEIFRLDKVLSIQYGKGLPERERVQGKYPVVGSNGIVGYHNQSLVRGPGIVVGRKGTIGAITWVDSDFWPIDTTYYVQIEKNNIDLKWLFFELVHLNLPKLHLSDVVPGLKRELVYSLMIPLPLFLEQQKIAGILSTVDEATQKTDEVIAKTERLKKGLMQELLTKGIGHKEFKNTKIGRIPKDWDVVKLEEVSKDFISGGTPSTKEPKFWNGDIPWIRSVHITKYYIDYSSVEQYVTKEGLENSAANIVPRNNLIVATRVGIGKSAINLIDVAINQDLTGIVLDKSKVDPVFIVWYLYSPKIIKLFESFSRGTTIKGVTQSSLRNLLTPLPPLEEQQKIAEILSTTDKKLELERNEKTRLEKIKQGLMDLLLTGKIRVKVN